VAHATLRMRFAVTETIQDTATPLAIDSGGRFVYLLTDKGLTVVDFGAAPLWIGHLSGHTAPGSTVVLRGSGFDFSTTATVGGGGASVNFTDENTLTLTIPGDFGTARYLCSPKVMGKVIRWKTESCFPNSSPRTNGDKLISSFAYGRIPIPQGTSLKKATIS
jgi:hypothetical protein